MLSLEDCIALCGLSPDEIDAIAEHEHVCGPPAASLGAYLLHEKDGPERIGTIIFEDIREALEHRRIQHARELLEVLRAFLSAHPDLLQDAGPDAWIRRVSECAASLAAGERRSLKPTPLPGP